MMHELASLCMSDIARLLGALGLLSLGIILILCGINRRRNGVIVIALFLCLGALVPTVLAIELPLAGSLAQIQTSGPNTPLWVGDWYTSRSPDAGGPGYHAFNIYIPCTVPSMQMITVELYDPESNSTAIGGAPYPDLDEIRPVPPAVPAPDNTTFTLTNPSGVVIAATTYTPTGGTSQRWIIFATFPPDATNGCGVYRLTTTTSNDDDNAWRLRVTPDDPDVNPGTGDEISLGNLQTSFQNTITTCQTFHFFVPVTDSILLSNFDMDVPGYCTSPPCTVVYTTPSGTVRDGTESGGTEWSGGGDRYPPSEDEIMDPEPGWWQAQLCLTPGNQYIFTPGGQAYFYDRPPMPDMTVSKDDGTATFNPDGVLTYTIAYANTGPGAALDVALTDTLPLSTTFVSCSGGLSCGEIPPPGSGIVTFSLGTIGAGESGSVGVSVHVDPDVPFGTITNIVELDYTDIVFSDYPPETDTDVDQYEEPTPNPGIEIAKTVYLGHDSGAGCPGSEIVTGTIGADVTYCFEVTNIGNTYLDSIVITDTLLGIPPAAVVLLSGSTPLAPGNSLVYYYDEGTISGDLVNTAETEGNPTDSGGNDLEGVDNPIDDDTAAVDEGAPPPPLGAIGDYVWHDKDWGKDQDPSEEGFGNITLWLYEDLDGNGEIDPGSEPIDTTETDPNGYYLFSPLSAGSYIVEVDENDPDLPEEVRVPTAAGQEPPTIEPLALTTSNPLAVTIGEGRWYYLDADFGFAGPFPPQPAPEPPKPKPPKREPSEPAPPPPAPSPATPAAPASVPPVETLTVERLPETGGFPDWFTVVFGVTIIIGAAGLLNLAWPGMRGRRDDGKEA